MNCGKKGTHYLRVTNIRGTKPTLIVPDCEFGKQYLAVMKTSFGQRKRTIELQRIPNALLIDTDYFIGDLDDGIIHIGTKHCPNHGNPKCNECPLNGICLGHNERQDLIKDYRT